MGDHGKLVCGSVTITDAFFEGQPAFGCGLGLDNSMGWCHSDAEQVIQLTRYLHLLCNDVEQLIQLIGYLIFLLP